MKGLIFLRPEQAGVEHQTKSKIIAIKRFEKGFYPVHGDPALIETMNGGPVPDDVVESAVSGSIFGWDAPISRKAHNWLAQRDGNDD